MTKRDIIHAKPVESASHSSIIQLRGHPVMLASDVAHAFGVEPRLIVQNIKNNNRQKPKLFPEAYAFQVSDDEEETLRSLEMIPRPGRGGSRARPWVISRKGMLRLIMIMRSPIAVQAAERIIDMFDDVMLQLYQGKKQIRVNKPSGLVQNVSLQNQVDMLRGKILTAIDDLLNTVVDTKEKKTVKDEISSGAKDAYRHLREWLRSKKVTNEKIIAETMFIMEKVEDMKIRRASEMEDAEINRQSKRLQIVQQKMDIVEKQLKLCEKLEPNAVIGLVGDYMEKPQSLPQKTQT